MIKKNRINAIDTFRGISISYMIIGHTAQYWLIRSDLWLYGFILAIFEVIGANAFILLAGIGLTLSYKAQQNKIETNTGYGKKQLIFENILRSSWIIVFGFITVIVGSLASGRLEFWAWYVLITIGIGRLIALPFLRYNPIIKLCMGMFFIILVSPVNNYLSQSSPVLHYLLFNTSLSETPFPFFGFFFIGTALGDWINEWNISLTDTSRNSKIYRYFFISGMLLVFFGILIGLEMNSDFIARGLIWALNFHESIEITELPLFLVRSSTPWSVYSLGFELILLGCLLKWDDHRFNVQVTNNEEARKNLRGLVLLGQYSLTIYISHYLLSLLFHNTLIIPLYIIGAITFYCLLYLTFWTWANKGSGKGTLEWVIKYTSTLILENSSTPEQT